MVCIYIFLIHNTHIICFQDSWHSTLTVHPSMDTEDRELTCRGTNKLGNQTKSCKFFIKRASELGTNKLGNQSKSCKFFIKRTSELG